MPTTIVARASRNEAELVGLMQQEVRRLHPELPVTNAMTMKQRQAMELVLFRIAVVSLGALGALGLLLAGVGLYAVVAYAVAQRTSELGIRIALGARPGDLTRLVVRDVTALVVAGIAIGSALSWTGVTVLESSVAQIHGSQSIGAGSRCPDDRGLRSRRGLCAGAPRSANGSNRGDSPPIGRR